MALTIPTSFPITNYTAPMTIAIQLSTNGTSIFGPTPNYYFQDTTNFDKLYFTFLPMPIVQGLRLIFGIVAINLFME